MLTVAPTPIGVKSTSLWLRFQYHRPQFSHCLLVDLSLPSGPPCLICVQLWLWCSPCLQPTDMRRTVPVPSRLLQPRPCRRAVVCLSLPAYLPMICFPKGPPNQSCICGGNPRSGDRTQLVLVTGLNSWVSSGCGSTRNRTVATGLTSWKTWPIGNGPVLPPKTRHFNITTLPPIEHLSSDRIVTWSVRRLCSSSHFFTSRCQICNPTNIRWVAIENLLISLMVYLYFTATQRISVWSQVWMQGVKEHAKLDNLHIQHVMIRSELKYSVAAKAVGTVKLEPRSSFNPGKNTQFYVRSGQQNCEDKLGQVFGRVWNRTGPFIRPKPRSLAGYWDPLLTQLTVASVEAMKM